MRIIAAAVACWLVSTISYAQGTFIQLFSPAEIIPSGLLDFEGQADYTVANTLYQSQGITFTIDNGQKVYIYDSTSLERASTFNTSSGTNVVATVRDIFDPNSTGAFHLNVNSLSPVFAMGTYFGNDQGGFEFDFTHVTMSIFDEGNNYLGAVTVFGNHNGDVDQFIGIRSAIPFTRARFENLGPSGGSSAQLGVILDDLMFESVPEPSTFALIGFGAVGLWFVRRK